MYMTTAEVADRFRVKVQTVVNWRYQQQGPDFLKLGRRVLYPITEIERFETTLASLKSLLK